MELATDIANDAKHAGHAVLTNVVLTGLLMLDADCCISQGVQESQPWLAWTQKSRQACGVVLQCAAGKMPHFPAFEAIESAGLSV